MPKTFENELQELLGRWMPKLIAEELKKLMTEPLGKWMGPGFLMRERVLMREVSSPTRKRGPYRKRRKFQGKYTTIVIKHKGNKSAAARELGIAESTLRGKLKLEQT